MSPSLLIALAVIGALVALAFWQDYKNRGGVHPDLLQATKGNKALAKRLLEDAKLRYPGKSERWYLEKVLYDLQRDGAGSVRKTRSIFSMTGREARETFFLIGMVLWVLNSITSLVDNIFRR
jgi:Tfp pilus assembly major pilin PilA